MGKIENLEKKLKNLEIRISKLEKGKKSESYSINTASSSSSLELKIVQNINNIGIQHLILLTLKIKSKQSKSKIEQTLVRWNKPVGSWFHGGNFNNRLLKKRTVMKDGKDKNNDELFSLTMKGIRITNKLIEKYNLR